MGIYQSGNGAAVLIAKRRQRFVRETSRAPMLVAGNGKHRQFGQRGCRLWKGMLMVRQFLTLSLTVCAVFGLPAGPAAAQQSGGTLKFFHRDSPASMSIHEEATI